MQPPTTNPCDTWQKVTGSGFTLRQKLASRLAAVGVAAATMLAGAAALAVPEINFDGVNNSYGTTKTMELPATTHPAGTNDYLYLFDPAHFVSPSTGYSGPAFYGGAWLTSADGSVTTVSNPRVRSSYIVGGATIAQSQMEVGLLTHTSTLASGASFFAFDAGGSFTLDSSSSLSLSISTGSQSTLRFTIRSGSQWYVSSFTMPSVVNTPTDYALTGQTLLSSMWAPWDPTGGANGRLGDVPASFTIAGNSLSDIQSVGYYTSYTSATSNQYAYVSKFAADLAPVPVPEPASLGLMAVGVVLCVRRRRAPRQTDTSAA